MSILHDHRLVALWREYSQRKYRTHWIAANWQEAYRFVKWSNCLQGNDKEIQSAQRAKARKAKGIPVRQCVVQAWGNNRIVETRFG